MTHSIDTDEDYVLRLNRQTEEFVIKQMVEVKKEMGGLKTEMSKMADKIKRLEEENNRLPELENGMIQLAERMDTLRDEEPHRSCVETMKVAFISAFTSIEYPQPHQKEPMETTPQASTSFFFQPSDVVKSTMRGDESSSSVGAHTEVREVSLKRKKPPTSTPRRETRIEDLTPEFWSVIKPFHKVDKTVTRDYLDKAQRAFIKYRADTVKRNNESITESLAKQVVQEGIQRGLSEEGFQPEQIEYPFEEYIMSRLQNEKKKLVRKENLESQSQRLASSIARELDD